jgi:hypothetical protein
MMTWRRFRQMSGHARLRVLEAAGALVITRACLHFLGFRRSKAAVEWLARIAVPKARPATPEEMAIAREVEKWELAAARHLPVQTNCLDRAFTLWFLLRKRGIASELRIGGRKNAGQFEAHAWVELSGTVFDDLADESTAFARFEKPANTMETQPL